MLAIEYEEVKEDQITSADKVNDIIEEKMKGFNSLINEYTEVVNVQRIGVDRF